MCVKCQLCNVCGFLCMIIFLSMTVSLRWLNVLCFTLQDVAWLGIVNDFRRANKLSPLTVDRFELAIDRFEKESFAASLDPRQDMKLAGSAASNNGHCCVCAETDSHSTNLLLVCDACSLTVHQVSLLCHSDCLHMVLFIPMWKLFGLVCTIIRLSVDYSTVVTVTCTGWAKKLDHF